MGRKRPGNAPNEPLGRGLLDVARRAVSAAARLLVTLAVEVVTAGAEALRFRASDRPPRHAYIAPVSPGAMFCPSPVRVLGFWASSPVGGEDGRSAAGRWRAR